MGDAAFSAKQEGLQRHGSVEPLLALGTWVAFVGVVSEQTAARAISAAFMQRARSRGRVLEGAGMTDVVRCI